MSTTLDALLSDVATLFRQGRFAEGHDAWAKATERLAAGMTPADAPKLMPALEALFRAQQQGDLMLFADLLDHVLLPALGKSSPQGSATGG